MTPALAVQPKKVRGLSLLQKRIMAVAAKGWITPHEACSCVEIGEYSDNWEAISAATASRALRRLVQRGLLNRVPSEYRGQSDVYRLTNWQGTIPWIHSQHSRIGCILRNTGGVSGGINHHEVLRQFESSVAERQKRLDTSLTKAERELGERLNTPLTEEQQKMLVEFAKDLASPERLNTSLTENQQPVLHEEISVDEGRSVLIGILTRSQLGNQQSLVATNDGDPC